MPARTSGGTSIAVGGAGAISNRPAKPRGPTASENLGHLAAHRMADQDISRDSQTLDDGGEVGGECVDVEPPIDRFRTAPAALIDDHCSDKVGQTRHHRRQVRAEPPQ